MPFRHDKKMYEKKNYNKKGTATLAAAHNQNCLFENVHDIVVLLSICRNDRDTCHCFVVCLRQQQKPPK